MKIKIYKLTCNCCNKLYIGSTKQENVLKRLYGHRSDFKIKTSELYKHFQDTGKESFNIEVLNDYEVKDFEEQRIIEQKYIEEYDTINNGFNTKNSYMSEELFKSRKRESDKKYNRNNRDKINIMVKIYRDKLKEENKYECIPCNYKTGRSDTFKRHCKSSRHIFKTSLSGNV